MGLYPLRYRYWLAVALLLPSVFFLQPVPIDETRYLGVAWNMHLGGQWLVPWVDGAPYPDKPPLLFWLINLAWAVTGVHAWTARLVEVLVVLATLPWLGALAGRLGAEPEAARAAQWLWLGCAASATFSGAVMFDMPLTLTTLIAWRASCGLLGPRWGGALLGLAAALGAGVLIKGPVAVLLGGLPALFGPLWLPGARARPGMLYLRLIVALAGAVMVALSWAIPAAAAGGPAYADAIFLRQTVNRVVTSFAHDRPWWWYLGILPLMVLPWWPGIGRGERQRRPGNGISLPDRFLLVSFVPGLLAFSLISGKQPHYLLPLLPALALAAGVRLADRRWRVVAWRVGLVLVAIGMALAIGLGRLAPPERLLPTVLCAAPVALLGLGLLGAWRRPLPVHLAALGMLATLGLAKLAFVVSVGPRYDVRSISARIAQAQQAGVPLLHAGRTRGLFTFAGRLRSPLPEVRDRTAVLAWADAHPDGWVIANDSEFDFTAAPLYGQPYLNRQLSIWRAGSLMHPAAERQTTIAERR